MPLGDLQDSRLNKILSLLCSVELRV